MKILALLVLVPACLVGRTTMGQVGWKETFYSHGCGNSYSQARHNAKKGAQEYARELEDTCASEEGNFVVRYSDGYCFEDTQNISCRVECTVIGKASCS